MGIGLRIISPNSRPIGELDTMRPSVGRAQHDIDRSGRKGSDRGEDDDIRDELVMKRLLDGQFDECDLTMRELELIERSIIKSLLGIYHSRIQYPSTAAITGAGAPSVATTAVKSA